MPVAIEFRKPTDAELSPDKHGESMIDISKRDWAVDEEKEERESRENIFTKFTKRNRKILLESVDPLKDIKTLSCRNCFRVEHSQGWASDNFEEEFKKFQGRLKLKSVSEKPDDSLKSPPVETGGFTRDEITVRFKRCEYCGIPEKIGLNRRVLKPEAWNKLQESVEEE